MNALLCWNCGTVVSLQHIKSVCPSCKVNLTTAKYDEAALPLVAERNQFDQLVSEQKGSLVILREKNARWKKLRSFPFLPSFRALKRAETALRQNTQSLSEATGAVDAHARSRYFASLWYQETRILPLSCEGSCTPLKNPSYSKDGQFFMHADLSSAEARGYVGEYLVFDQIATLLQEGQFGHAYLIPKLFIPQMITNSSKCQVGNTYAEIDMLLITQKAVFVIEVKNIYGEIIASYKKNAGDYRVWVKQWKSNHDRQLPRKEDAGPKQNQYHLSRLLRRCPQIKPEETFNVVTYINHAGFTAPSKQGHQHTYITTDKNSPSTVTNILVSIFASKPNKHTEQEVDKLYALIKTAYTDPDGSKNALHFAEVAASKRANEKLASIRKGNIKVGAQ